MPAALADLASLAYQAALDPSLWPAAFASFARAGKADSFALRCPNPLGDQPLIEACGAPLLGADPGSLLSGDAPIGLFSVGRSFPVASPLGSPLDARAFFFREPESGPFPDRSRALLEAALPHIESACRLSAQAFLHRECLSIASEALESLSVGMLAVRPDGELLCCNREARSMLERAGTLALVSGRALPSNPALRPRFSEALAECAGAGHPATLLLPGRDGPGSRCCATLRPLGERSGSSRSSGALILLSPVGRSRVATAAQIMQAFGMTPAEARLARAVASGETLEEYAEGNGIKISTVKTQLRSALAKAGADRQATLARAILSVPAAREPAALPAAA